jgi:hypothetical protein
LATSDQSLTDRELATELRDTGIEVRSVWDLVNTDRAYRPAIPVLVSWLERMRAADVSEGKQKALYQGIVRALTVKEARAVATPLLFEEFHRIREPDTRWIIGNALDVLAGPAQTDRLLAIAREPAFGRSRQMVVSALGRVGRNRPDVLDTLVSLLTDDDLVLHAVNALARLRAAGSRPQIEPLLQHERPAVSQAARSALRKFDQQASAST